MRKHLFQIGAELERTLEELEAYCVDNQTDELTDELIDRLNINQNELDEKLDAYYHVITQIESEKEAVKAYKKSIIDKANAKEKALDSNITRLKKLMTEAVTKFGETRKNGNKFYKLSNCSVNATKSNKVVITNEELIPKQFIKEKVTYSVSKTEIKKAIKAGEIVNGAIIDDSEFNLSFK